MIAALTALIGAFFTIALVDTCLPRRQQLDIRSEITRFKKYCSICRTSNELTWVSELNCRHIYCPTCYEAHVRNRRGCHLCNFHIHSIKILNYITTRRTSPNLTRPATTAASWLDTVDSTHHGGI